VTVAAPAEHSLAHPEPSVQFWGLIPLLCPAAAIYRFSAQPGHFGSGPLWALIPLPKYSGPEAQGEGPMRRLRPSRFSIILPLTLDTSLNVPSDMDFWLSVFLWYYDAYWPPLIAVSAAFTFGARFLSF
jgi:hypothetical protein